MGASPPGLKFGGATDPASPPPCSRVHAYVPPPPSLTQVRAYYTGGSSRSVWGGGQLGAPSLTYPQILISPRISPLYFENPKKKEKRKKENYYFLLKTSRFGGPNGTFRAFGVAWPRGPPGSAYGLLSRAGPVAARSDRPSFSTTNQ